MKKYKNILVKSKNRKSTKETSVFLNAFANKMAEKKIKFAQGDYESEIELPDNVLFSVKANEKKLRKKGLRRKITLQIKWYEGQDLIAPLEVK